ncbi:chemotaxis protein CheW [Photobacterium ganghwense]|uniref:chemotaxis protein CheW n=1 Tax=Photobacterium ganghwense TaxID=320778 RepID=UPI0039EFB6E8
MSDSNRLSSQQALDDYFFDLLVEPEPEPVPETETETGSAADSSAHVASVPVAAETPIAGDDEPEPENTLEDPRPDDGALPPLAGDLTAETSEAIAAAPFDFSSLESPSEEAADAVMGDMPWWSEQTSQSAPQSPQLSPARQVSADRPNDWIAQAPEAQPVALENVQRLLDQVSRLSTQMPTPTDTAVAVPEPDSGVMNAAPELDADWQAVMAHEEMAHKAMAHKAVQTEFATETLVLSEVQLSEQLPSEVQELEPSESESTDLEPLKVLPAAKSLQENTVDQPEPESGLTAAPETQTGVAPPDDWNQQKSLGNEFQALFFEVNGVTFAVPLTELGGIHQLGDLNHLLGRPPWYLGLMSTREQQLDVVDTARWAMAEKLTDDDHREGYRYVVLLGESKWGLACNTLLGTEALPTGSVRWREKAGKRPWLAGMVKEKMCALIHVSELISMLNAGLDVNTKLGQP